MDERIGHYRIVGELGRGGMGVVYKAHEESLNRFVALKVLGEHLTQDEEYLNRFLQEARSAANLNHPNIVQIYFIGQDEGRHYFAMEYVSGTNVEKMIGTEGRIEPSRAAQIVMQAAAGLAAAHQQGIIHRDIKPANLMVNEAGLVKIADFGIAFVTDRATRLTGQGMLVGTPSYMSPEQCLGEPVDPRTDIYSLGVSFYEMLTGEIPYRADSPLLLMRQIIEVEPRPVEQVVTGVDPRIASILQRMVAKKPEDRYPNAAAVASELHNLLRSEARPGWEQIPVTTPPPSAVAEAHPPQVEAPAAAPETTGTEPAAGATPPGGRRSFWPLAAILAVLLLGGTALAYWSGMLERFQSDETSSPAAATETAEPRAEEVIETLESATPGEASEPVDEPSVPDQKAKEPPDPDPGTDATLAQLPVDRDEASPSPDSATAGTGTSRQVSPLPPEASSSTVDPAPTVGAATTPPPPRAKHAAGTIVMVVGDRLLAPEVERYVEGRLQARGVELIDERGYSDLWPIAESDRIWAPFELAQMVGTRASRLVVGQIEYLGERELYFGGRREISYRSRVTVQALDLVSGTVLMPAWSEEISHTQIEIERSVRNALQKRVLELGNILVH